MERFPTEKILKKKPGWKEIPIGGIVTNAGSSLLKKTGSWRSFRPILDKAKCINCFTCYAYCPDNAIKVENGKVRIDYEYCKGCGICANMCPVKAIKMEEEKESEK
ncbi:MAG TPA: 4Fe-4S dicluster domain-containing protein [Candidatus Aenigmarchaeota archaeon]|nr:MAG: ferredoxin [Candidatus Aenigmarchaeota archaeon]HDD45929.1 4Fe-4S dicluster domain-containing protein [Candidatus Aenigmarchaeota archaeon]